MGVLDRLGYVSKLMYRQKSIVISIQKNKINELKFINSIKPQK